MKHSIFILMLMGSLLITSCADRKASWISTTDNARWQRQPEVELTHTTHQKSYIEILLDEPQQTMEGFGACFNENSWDALQLADDSTRNQILKDLFDPNDGLKFTYCRTPMAANDHSRNWYSYNETDQDFEMKNFSIERDKEAVIPYIKSALKLNPHIKLWACPWSAPTWMKTNKHYANMSGHCNDLSKEKEVPIYTDQFIQEPEYLQAYALYFSKYLDAYQAEGINISMVMFQNAPFVFSQWPNGSWKPESIANFNFNYLGPQLAQTHPDVEIYAGTFNTSNPKVYEAIMNNPDATKYIKGFGVQWEGKDIFPELSKRYPEMKLMQSESECGWGGFGWGDAEHTFNLMQRYINHGASAYMGWNMVLKDDGSSTWCWKQNALIRIMSDTKEVIYTPEYYVYKHVSSYVPTGSVKLPAKTVHEDGQNNSPARNVLSFRTPDQKVVIIIGNYLDREKNEVIKVGNSYLAVTLQPKSFNTFEVLQR